MPAPTTLLDALFRSVFRTNPETYLPFDGPPLSLQREVQRLPFYVSILGDSPESALRLVHLYGPMDDITVEMCDLNRLNRWEGSAAAWIWHLQHRQGYPRLMAEYLADHLYNFRFLVLNLETRKVAFDPALPKIHEAIDFELNDAQLVTGDE